MYEITLFISLALWILSSIVTLTSLFRLNGTNYLKVLSWLVILLTISIGFLIYQNYKLTSPLIRIDNFLYEFQEPFESDFNFTSNGELKWIMIRWVWLIEKYNNLYPEQYDYIKELVFGGHSPINDEDFWNERSKLKDGADAVYQIIKWLRSLETRDKKNLY